MHCGRGAVGLKQIETFGFELPPNNLESVKYTVQEALVTWPEELSKRFVTRFVENVILASGARYVYADPPLALEEMRSFLSNWIEVFRCFTHTPRRGY